MEKGFWKDERRQRLRGAGRLILVGYYLCYILRILNLLIIILLPIVSLYLLLLTFSSLSHHSLLTLSCFPSSLRAVLEPRSWQWSPMTPASHLRTQNSFSNIWKAHLGYISAL